MRLTSRAGYNVSCTFPNPDDDDVPDFDFEEVLASLQQHPDFTSAPGIHTRDITQYDTRDIARVLEYITNEYDEPPWIQTDPTTLTEVYTKLLYDYDVGVNIVTDGDSRITNNGVIRQTWADGRSTGDISVLEDLQSNGLTPKIVLVLHHGHVEPDGREILREWMRSVSDLGVTGSVDPAIPPTGAPEVTPNFANPEELAGLYKEMWLWVRDFKMQWGPHSYIGEYLQGNTPSLDLTHGDIGPFTTGPPYVIRSNGFLTTCKRRLKEDGNQIPQYTNGNNVRTQSLQRTSVEDGGCRSCQWWDFCKGGDSVHGLRNDWRHRSVFCNPLQALYGLVNRDMEAIAPNLKGDVQ